MSISYIRISKTTAYILNLSRFLLSKLTGIEEFSDNYE